MALVRLCSDVAHNTMPVIGWTRVIRLLSGTATNGSEARHSPMPRIRLASIRVEIRSEVGSRAGRVGMVAIASGVWVASEQPYTPSGKSIDPDRVVVEQLLLLGMGPVGD